MKRKTFGEFVDKKKRDGVKQLRLIKQLLEKNGLKVENYLTSENDSPYIFCKSPIRGLSFDGIRIYKIGEMISFRVQKEKETHPYGSAYTLPVEDMFNDFMSEPEADQKKAGKKVIDSIVKEVNQFFARSKNAENNSKDDDIRDKTDGILMRTNVSDYSSNIFSKA